MSIAVLPSTTTVAQLRKQIVYTRTRLYADVRGEPFRGRFDLLLKEWKALLLREVDLQDEQISSGAEVESEDMGLDALVDEVSEATEKDDALRELLFHKKSPSVFKKPIAGIQLSAMETWEGTLSRSTSEAAQGLAVKVGKQVARANNAVNKRTEATQKLREFYATAERRQFIEKVNVARMEVFTHFVTMATQDPSLGLTQQYARSFFLSLYGGSPLHAEEELSQVQAQLEELRGELAQYESREKELLAQKEAQAADEAQEQAQRAREEELERELAAIKAQRAKKKRPS